MDVMCIGVLVFGILELELSFDQQCDVVDCLFVVFLVIMIYWYCFIYEGQCIDCNSDELIIGGYFFVLFYGKKFSELYVKVMNVLLIFYVEYEFNVFIFIVWVCVLILFDFYFCVIGVIGLLCGLLYGGVNEVVMELIECFFLLQEVIVELLKMFECKDKIMGFGYVIYKDFDLCNEVIKGWLKQFVDEVGDKVLFVVFEVIDKIMWEQKKLFFNVDFYYVLVYYFMGILIKLFMLIFVCLWISGWIVYVFEQCVNNCIICLSVEYIGVEQCVFVLLE